MAAGVAVATLALTPPAVADTLSKSVEKAIATHPELLRDKSLDLAAEQQIDQAFSRFLPTLDLEGSTGYEYTDSPSTRGRNGAGRNRPQYRQLWRTDTSTVGRQLAFDGFGALTQLRLARHESRAASGLVYDTAERVGIRVVQAFMDTLRTQEFVRIAEENTKEHEVIFTQIKDLAQAGRGLGVVGLQLEHLAIRADGGARSGRQRPALLECVGFFEQLVDATLHDDTP